MRFSKCHFITLILVLVNLVLLLFYTHLQNETNFLITKQEKLDITIIIPEFENFENDIEDTVSTIESRYEDIPILVLTETIPYPYFHLPARSARFVVTGTNPTKPRYMTDPLHYVKTKYILVLPDGFRITEKGVLEELVWMLRKSTDTHIIASPIVSTSCSTIDIDLKRWSLKYIPSNKDDCQAMTSDSLLLFDRNTLSNFSELFTPPFFQSFYLQAKLRNLKLYVTENKYVSYGKILFASNHNKWKHLEKKKIQTSNLYRWFGIKRVVNTKGIESYYGCSKKTPRCFPTVLDVPSYLYNNKWTPPCCLNVLRETSKHVFYSLEAVGMKYWLEGGSLLGAARYGDIIPWDYDVDLGIFMDDIKKSALLSSAWSGIRQVDKKGFVWERASEGEFIRVQYSQTNHLHVDIFPFFERNGIMTKNTWFKTHRQDMEFPSHYLKPLERMLFVGVEAMVPNHHKEFLEMKFGKGVIENPKYPFPEKLIKYL